MSKEYIIKIEVKGKSLVQIGELLSNLAVEFKVDHKAIRNPRTFEREHKEAELRGELIIREEGTDQAPVEHCACCEEINNTPDWMINEREDHERFEANE